MRKFIRLFENHSIYMLVLIVVILFCLSYWTYLYFTTQMSITNDAVGYENSGRVVFEQGWTGYFKNGPDREPFYIFTIAFSMKMGESFSLHYHYFQKIIQVLLLFSAQLLLLYLLDRLQIHNFIKILGVLYFGISPAIVNAAFSLYSEIIAFPFVLLAIILLGRSWKSIYEGNIKHVFILSIGTAIALLLLTLGKGAFRFISIICLFPFFMIFLRSLIAGDWGIVRKTGVFILTTVLIVNSAVLGIKLLNKEYNGRFTYTGGRYNYIFWGSSIKRSRPLTKKIVLSHIASIPGVGICNKFFDKDTCRYTEWFGSMDTTSNERIELIAPIEEKDRDKAMVNLAIGNIADHPFNFAFFSIVELFKLFFWESTQIGYVSYPDGLEKLFEAMWFRYGIRLALSLLTVAAYFYLFYFCWRQRGKLFDLTKDHEQERFAFLIFMFVTLFIGIYAICYVLTRYSLPIASLFLLSIAFMFDRIIKIKGVS